MTWKPHNNLVTGIQNYKQQSIRELNKIFFFPPENIETLKETFFL